MKKNIGPKIIVAVIVLIMIVPIVVDVVKSIFLTTISYKDLKNTISDTVNFDFALVYVAPSKDNKSLGEDKKEIKRIVSDGTYKSVSNNKPLKSFYMDSSKLTDSEREDIFSKDSIEDTAYMFVVNGEVVKIVEGQLEHGEFVDYVEFYSMNAEEISEDLIHYNVPKDAAEFTKLAKDKNKVTMFVLGKDSCFYCNQFKITYSTVAEEYNLDNIYYIDSSSYDSIEYQKILDSGLTIPAKCSDTKEEIKLQSGFGTPLTLFTKNGKTIDCINGYVNKNSLITQLKTVGIIEE